MQEQHERWYSPTLGTDFEVLRYGHYGRPVLIFPTTLGRHYEARDMRLVHSVSHLIDAGKVIVYCPDTVNHHSWYNRSSHPGDKVRVHKLYDQMIRHELIPRIQQRHNTHGVAVAGCSFGAYTASNFAFKHPDVVDDLICMSGSFDIRSFLDGYYDEHVYFNNPVDFLPHASDPRIWEMGIILGTSEWDICRTATERMSQILNRKSIGHWYDLRGWVEHDWPLWRQMFPDYLARISS